MPTNAKKIALAKEYIAKLTAKLEFAEVGAKLEGLPEDDRIAYQMEAVLTKHFLNDTIELLNELLEGEVK